MKNLLSAVIAAAALGCAPAFAQAPAFAPGWYLGLGLGEAKLGTSASEFTGGTSANLDDRDRAIAVRGGVRLHRNFAVELGYYDFGKYGYGYEASSFGPALRGTAKARSLGVSLVAIAPLERFDIYGRVGYARSELKTQAALDGIIGVGPLVDPRTKRENELFGGVGARFNVGREWGVFAEYQRHDKLEIDAWLIGVDLRF